MKASPPFLPPSGSASGSFDALHHRNNLLAVGMKPMKWIILPIALLMMALPGCGIKVKNDTPKELLETLEKAFQALDTDALAGCYLPQQQTSAKAVFTSVKKMKDKTDSVKKTVAGKLGKDVAEKLFEKNSIDRFNQLACVTKDAKLDWGKIEIEEKGDTAEVFLNRTGFRSDKILHLKKVNKKWYLQNDETRRELEKGVEYATKLMDAIIKGLDLFDQSVKQGKVTKDNASDELQRAFSKAALDGSTL